MTEQSWPERARDIITPTLEGIIELYEAYTALTSGESEEVDADGTTFNDAEDIETHCHEMPLSVEVRNEWHAPGSDGDDKPVEFRILLATGGPAIQIIGGLHHGQADTPEMQAQDWGTPWKTAWLPNDHASKAREDNALNWFCGLFYFGE